jgi:hypothetical protein
VELYLYSSNIYTEGPNIYTEGPNIYTEGPKIYTEGVHSENFTSNTDDKNFNSIAPLRS